jgi:hypothetical protein
MSKGTCTQNWWGPRWATRSPGQSEPDGPRLAGLPPAAFKALSGQHDMLRAGLSVAQFDDLVGWADSIGSANRLGLDHFAGKSSADLPLSVRPTTG